MRPWLAVLCGAALPLLATAADALPRVMSTNLCADIVLLSLADAAQVVSVSARSQDPARSSLAALARRHASNDGTAEEVIAARPDVVLASRRWQARHQGALLARHGIRIVTVPFPDDWPGIFDSTRKIGVAIGREAAAEALIAELEGRLAALRPAQPEDAPRAPLRALYLRPNGGTAGAKTHVDAVLRAAGLANHAALGGRVGWGRASLEEVVADPPELLVTSQMVHDTAYARAGFSRHPQLRALADGRPALALAHNDWGCSNWQLIEAAEELADGRRRQAHAGVAQ
ncbi:ABC transporter substrate-binding protein [Pseudothauera nasutitermitis]|uniref:ABC transporter substrate-binding protein n=1 Tax=Pseudothauera nasutitermitis TaxID=2565930 RepID=A0A4S4AX30_9RHOO|nr:ABC transporter substrate-binding protein [Pseudothauera nasutitermitis]THF64632.1 ABC transporter substrate-binding protein [Pseudothauera nasutitermitis]